MEEWEYLEGHQDRYQDVKMEERRPLTPRDGSRRRNPPERCPRPLYPQDCPEENHNIPEEHQGEDLIDIKVEVKDEVEETMDVWADQQDGSRRMNPPERCPRPLYPQDCPEENHNIPEDHQREDLISIKEEEDLEEAMSGGQQCMNVVKEETPDVTTAFYSNMSSNEDLGALQSGQDTNENNFSRMPSSSAASSQSARGSAASSSEGEGSQREQRGRGQGVASGRRVSQRDQGDSIDVDLLISCIQERGPLWDSRDPRHMDQVVLRRLWAEVAKSLWDGFDSASAKDKGNFIKKLRTRWRSMKDRFNKGLRNEEEQSRSGAAAAKSVPYKYNRALQFLRPVLGRRQTHSSTLERARPSEAERHASPSDPCQPSHSDSRLAPPSGEPAAGPSGVPLPEASGAPSFGNSRQRQRASDRPAMPEFLHMSTVFQNCFEELSDKMDTRLSNIDRRLENLEAELSNPAKPFLSTIGKGMVEHLTPELQISVMQSCNNAYVRALQQSRVAQSATLPVVPSPASMTPTPAAEPLQPPHPGPSAERRHHMHHSIVPPTPAPARPSSSRSRHDVGAAAGEKKRKRRKRTHTEALAAPIQTPSSRRGSSRSRSSQGPSRTRPRLVLPPPSPTEVAVSSPVYPAEGLDLPSSLLDSGSSYSSSSPHSQPETYHSPMVAEVDTP
ncbi:uncharacterized protein LOC143793526 isoform X3 [Ranitomeya variabilis]|uniref:uncharacterized protein LOC143793526 isoform X3 n=1 Tax=Ranitomeya variabilis TaxID=490064 RepID=UPI004056144B